MSDLLYRWPATAELGTRIPKEKLYEHGSVTPPVKERFVSDVQRIVWAYKLANATLHLTGTDAVPEIQVFRIEAKGTDVSDQVLAAIDKAIPIPIVFEVSRGAGESEQIRMVAAHKQLGPGASRLSSYYSTGWQPADAERRPLPTAISLNALYAALLDPLTPVATRPGEKMSEVGARLDTAHRLEREIAALERKLRTEPQFNRKVELRRTLKTKQAELDDLR